MTAKNLIAHDIPALSLEQTGRDAFHLLSDYHVKHLPVVNGTQLAGILSEEDIFNHKLYEPVGEYDFSMLRHYAVREQEHIFEVMRVMGENRLTVIPVIDDAGNYVGLISQNDLLRYFATTAAFTETGAVLVLEMSRRDYSMTTIARINRHDLGKAIASLERHEYLVKEQFGGLEYADEMKERFDSFMNYLNL
jgi:CBS domain-containing protein